MIGASRGPEPLTSAAGPRARELECGLCGRRFREDRAQPACASCPLARACRYVRCPHCGYENPLEPAWIERGRGRRGAGRDGGFWRRLVSGFGARRPVTAAGTLLELQPGQRATVAGLEDPASAEGRALASLGVLPGVTLEVVQRYPAWIVRVDHAEIAFDDDLAAGVRLAPA